MACVRCSASSAPNARFFVNLAFRTPAPLQQADFLLPRCLSPSVPRPSSQASVRSKFVPRSVPIHSSRPFSTTVTKKATVCIQNPQTDDDGNPMTLEITTRAAKRLSEIMTKDANPNLALRIQVESGGCHGFQYLMSLITIPASTTKDAADPSSSIINEDDTIFQYQQEGGNTGGSPGVVPTIILDEPSLDLLKGSKVDFTQELIGSQFKIVDNPYATSSCGCGTSFDIQS